MPTLARFLAFVLAQPRFSQSEFRMISASSLLEDLVSRHHQVLMFPEDGNPCLLQFRQVWRNRRKPSLPCLLRSPDGALSTEAAVPTAISRTTFSSNWTVEPPASCQLPNATETPISAAAGMVVTEMNTPISALARDEVKGNHAYDPGQDGDYHREPVGGVDQVRNGPVAAQVQLRRLAGRPDRHPKHERDHDRGQEPCDQGAAIAHRGRCRRLIPSATAMIALYSGPTTIAPTMRICELLRMPTAPISPAITSRMKKLGNTPHRRGCWLPPFPTRGRSPVCGNRLCRGGGWCGSGKQPLAPRRWCHRGQARDRVVPGTRG